MWIFCGWFTYFAEVYWFRISTESVVIPSNSFGTHWSTKFRDLCMDVWRSVVHSSIVKWSVDEDAMVILAFLNAKVKARKFQKKMRFYRNYSRLTKEAIQQHFASIDARNPNVGSMLKGHQLPPKVQIPGVQSVICVASGKGGVGKSTTAGSSDIMNCIRPLTICQSTLRYHSVDCKNVSVFWTLISLAPASQRCSIWAVKGPSWAMISTQHSFVFFSRHDSLLKHVYTSRELWC